MAILVGVGLTIVQVNASALRKKAHSNPGLGLYGFKWYRLGLAIAALVVGLLIVIDALDVA